MRRCSKRHGRWICRARITFAAALDWDGTKRASAQFGLSRIFWTKSRAVPFKKDGESSEARHFRHSGSRPGAHLSTLSRHAARSHAHRRHLGEMTDIFHQPNFKTGLNKPLRRTSASSCKTGRSKPLRRTALGWLPCRTLSRSLHPLAVSSRPTRKTRLRQSLRKLCGAPKPFQASSCTTSGID